MKLQSEGHRPQEVVRSASAGEVPYDADLMQMLVEARSLVVSLEVKLGLRDHNGEPVHPIVRWRQARGMSQTELASRVGISPPALNRIEHRPGFAGRAETRKRIAEALNVSEEYLQAPADTGRDKALRRLRKLIDETSVISRSGMPHLENPTRRQRR